MSGLTVGKALAPRKSSGINRVAFGDNGMTLIRGFRFGMTSRAGSVMIIGHSEMSVVTGVGRPLEGL
ncbi:hypothetical protein BWP39_16615 [Paraburkholderia acidicola]|uniref:Uncharacterized protein n=1 Tax=Paraburkholderia acidicola TaxID=1912599 RepID=A0A2A4F171_9BURK|nr:hypothetical protein BWP39_16615 [Paraburkholderia acidicola]